MKTLKDIVLENNTLNSDPVSSSWMPTETESDEESKEACDITDNRIIHEQNHTELNMIDSFDDQILELDTPLSDIEKDLKP